jgi:hypothetical protein
VRLEGLLSQFEKSCDFIRDGTSDLPACSVVPQQIILPRAPRNKYTNKINAPVPSMNGIYRVAAMFDRI